MYTEALAHFTSLQINEHLQGWVNEKIQSTVTDFWLDKKHFVKDLSYIDMFVSVLPLLL